MNLSTTYLGLQLTHPFMVGASPLADHLDTVRQLEDGGSAASVLHSLFEEQVTMAASGRIHHMDPFDKQFAAVLSDFPAPDRYALAPDEYPEQLRRVKAAMKKGAESRRSSSPAPRGTVPAAFVWRLSTKRVPLLDGIEKDRPLLNRRNAGTNSRHLPVSQSVACGEVLNVPGDENRPHGGQRSQKREVAPIGQHDRERLAVVGSTSFDPTVP